MGGVLFFFTDDIAVVSEGSTGRNDGQAALLAEAERAHPLNPHSSLGNKRVRLLVRVLFLYPPPEDRATCLATNRAGFLKDGCP
ncbi:hypothetical protein KIN20_004600 [Parelaphostrongylus tenuis]|uniref:Uncharacterized protein n=1 Tax=Parelaphostrongylus tenuis TaxID=148309 RepID=A0AAD5M3C6_PARTN|nr:hypothetical protein KIN20_004600 [Parelaphostrongylus tenuis]